MMGKSKNIPAIRFKGFEGEWAEKLIKDIAPLQRGFDLPTQNIVDGDIPIAYSNGILNYHNKAKCKAPGIVTGRSGTIGKFTFIKKGYYWPHNTSLWVTDFCGNTPVFIYYLYQTINIEQSSTGSGVPTLNRNDVHRYKCKIATNTVEQSKIGIYLQNLDELINASQSKLEKLKNIKKACLEKMFPKKGSTVPEIRFKGFTEPWGEKKFNELYKKVSEKNDLSYGIDKIISVANMYFKPDVYISNKEYLKTYNIFKLGDIAFEGNKSKHFLHGRFVENTIGDGIVSHVFDVFRPITDFDLNFWKYAINNEHLMKELLIRCTKSSTMMTNLVADDFLNECFKVPCIEEQKKIGCFLTELDSQISLNEQQLEKLKNIKKACLERMFVNTKQ